MGKKGMIVSDNLASLRSYYRISDCVELLAPSEGETLRDHRKGCICLNEWMLKAGQRGLSSSGVRASSFLEFRPLLLGEDRRGVRMARHRAPHWALIHLPGDCRRQSLATPIIECGRRSVRRRESAYLPFLLLVGLVKKGSAALDKEAQERLVSLALSRDEAHRFGLLVIQQRGLSSSRTTLNDIQQRGLSSSGVRASSFLEFRPLLLGEDRRGARMARHRAPHWALIHLPGDCRRQSLAAPIIERG
ncbi:hypothetical protein ACLOJK_028716 [Asimina triloba]